jgi:hypothetical protein
MFTLRQATSTLALRDGDVHDHRGPGAPQHSTNRADVQMRCTLGRSDGVQELQALQQVYITIAGPDNRDSIQAK